MPPVYPTGTQIYPGTTMLGPQQHGIGVSATQLTPYQKFVIPAGSLFPNLKQLWQRNVGVMTTGQEKPQGELTTATLVDSQSPAKPIEGCIRHQISLTQTTTAASHQNTTALPSLQIHPTASSQSPSKESSIQPAHPQMTVAEPSTTTSSPSVRPSTVSTPAVRLPSHINATSEVTTMTSLPSSARPSHQITVIEATPFP